MTPPTPPPSDTPRPTPEDAEVVNAYVDDEATSEEVAEVEGDADLRAAAVRVRSLRAALGDELPTTPDGDIRETHIVAALSEFEPVSAPVSDLSAHRERKAWHQRVPMGAVAAAAVIVLVAVVAGIAQLDSDEGTDTAAVADEDTISDDLAEESTDLSGGDDGAEVESGGSAGQAPTTTMSTMDAPQPSYETVDDFLDAVEQMPSSDAAAVYGGDDRTESDDASDGTEDPGPLDNCPEVRDRYSRDFGDIQLVTATVDGRDMVAIVYVDDGDRHADVFDVSGAGCALVAER